VSGKCSASFLRFSKPAPFIVIRFLVKEIRQMMFLKDSFRCVVRLSCMVCSAALVVAALAGRADALPPPPVGAPEIDPGSLASALVLLAGGVLMLRGRIRR
jgi:hypothetical protein